MAVDQVALERIGKELLLAIGEDPGRDGLKETPARWATWWREFMRYDPGTLATSFSGIANADQMVIVKGMRVFSLCEHHLLPFWADVSVGYIPAGKVLGLSKFARIAHKHAHRLQVQERLVEQIADEIQERTGSDHVAVLAQGQHLCMLMRGIRTDGLLVSSVMRGRFLSLPSTRQEFLSVVQASNA